MKCRTIAVQESYLNTQLIEAFVVPIDEGAALLIDTDYGKLDAEAGPFQLALYARVAMSPGEEAVIRSRVEAQLFDYAVRMASVGRRWLTELVVGIVELAVLGLLLAYLIVIWSPLHAVIVVVAVLGFAPTLYRTGLSVRHRRVGIQARSILEFGEVLPTTAIGRNGDSVARLRSLWRVVEESGGVSELMSLERQARIQLRWTAAARFYRGLASTTDDRRGTLESWSRLVGFGWNDDPQFRENLVRVRS